MAPSLSRTLGRYELIMELAKSQLGPLWIARPSSEGSGPSTLAIRRVDTNPVEASEQDRLSEAAWWALELQHECIARSVDVVMTEGELGMVTEYHEGEPLRSLMRLASFKRRPIPAGVALRIALDLLDGLHHAHGEAPPLSGSGASFACGGAVPDSVLVCTDGRTRLLDTGIASIAYTIESISHHPDMAAYASPEQIDGAVPNSRSDVFAVGVMLWEMLTSKRLFVGANFETIAKRVKTGPIASLDNTKPVGGDKIPQAAADIVAKALERDPEARYTNAGEMADAIREHGGGVLASEDDLKEVLETLAGTAIKPRQKAIERAQSKGAATPGVPKVAAAPRASAPSLGPSVPAPLTKSAPEAKSPAAQPPGPPPRPPPGGPATRKKTLLGMAVPPPPPPRGPQQTMEDVDVELVEDEPAAADAPSEEALVDALTTEPESARAPAVSEAHEDKAGETKVDDEDKADEAKADEAKADDKQTADEAKADEAKADDEDKAEAKTDKADEKQAAGDAGATEQKSDKQPEDEKAEDEADATEAAEKDDVKAAAAVFGAPSKSAETTAAKVEEKPAKPAKTPAPGLLINTALDREKEEAQAAQKKRMMIGAAAAAVVVVLLIIAFNSGDDAEATAEAEDTAAAQTTGEKPTQPAATAEEEPEEEAVEEAVDAGEDAADAGEDAADAGEDAAEEEEEEETAVAAPVRRPVYRPRPRPRPAPKPKKYTPSGI